MQRRDHSGTRHRHFRYISGAGEEPISMDGTTMGQCLAAHGGVPLRFANIMVMA